MDIYALSKEEQVELVEKIISEPSMIKACQEEGISIEELKSLKRLTNTKKVKRSERAHSEEQKLDLLHKVLEYPSLRKGCAALGIPRNTFLNWRKEFPGIIPEASVKKFTKTRGGSAVQDAIGEKKPTKSLG